LKRNTVNGVDRQHGLYQLHTHLIFGLLRARELIARNILAPIAHCQHRKVSFRTLAPISIVASLVVISLLSGMKFGETQVIRTALMLALLLFPIAALAASPDDNTACAALSAALVRGDDHDISLFAAYIIIAEAEDNPVPEDAINASAVVVIRTHEDVKSLMDGVAAYCLAHPKTTVFASVAIWREGVLLRRNPRGNDE